MKKIKIGYFADGPWSYNAFDLLIKDDSIEIAFIIPRTDSKDSVLLGYSQKYNIPYLKGYNINSIEFYNIAASFNCDLFVSMSFNQIFKSRIFSLPHLGTINCHAGKLPFYRGRNILNWALINDEKEFGITVHFIDEGIDTGDIILQRCFPISDADDYNSLLEISYTECASILFDSIKSLQLNNFVRIKQINIDKIGFYCGQRKEGDEVIKWNQSTRELFNFIRALSNPGPMATTFLNGNKIMINKASIIKDAVNYKCINGLIVGKSNRGFLVKTEDNIIEISQLYIENDIKLKVGDRLG
jgi:methionyl-tRNA formyltransferase